jgi:DNA polymerase
MKYGTILRAGMGVTTVIADFDFETYSPAGFVWDEREGKFRPPHGAKVKGLPAVGVACYAEHPETEVLSLAYDLKDGDGPRLWVPGERVPLDLFEHLAAGKLLEAWNAGFEVWVWEHVCRWRYHFPPLPLAQIRCAKAKARAFSMPGGLEDVGRILGTIQQKDKRGAALLQRFSMPRNPTKTDTRTRIYPSDDTERAQELYQYNVQDIVTEAEISSRIPDLTPFELEFWQCDQAINRRGVQIDKRGVYNCIAIVEQAHHQYNQQLHALTQGAVTKASELQKLRVWMDTRGVRTDVLDADTITRLLKGELPDNVRTALLIRERIGSAAVKKLYAMRNQVTQAGRLHDLFVYHSARTGRAAGAGPQPQNLPNSGPYVRLCTCGRYYGLHHKTGCPLCGTAVEESTVSEWETPAVEQALDIIKTENLTFVEFIWGDAVAVVSGCLRGLFIAAPGHDLLCSDYKAIEAVVLAALAGEEWRLDVFRTHGLIYEMSASKITGIPFTDFIEHYEKNNKQHHPMRKKVGKVAELASGYQGWVGAWRQFGADAFFTEEERTLG